VFLRLTVQDAHSREANDVEVVASPEGSVGSLLGSLPLSVDGRDCFVGATKLDPRSRLAGGPVLTGAVVSVGGPGPDYHLVRGAAAGTMHVMSGPDAGFGVALQPGRHTIGRTSESGVCLHDTDVSRKHAVLEVLPDGRASISDEGSTNGTFVNAVRVTGPTALGSDDVVQVGSDTLRWASAGSRALRVAQTSDGHLEFDRVFAATPAVPEGEVALPPPEPQPRSAAATFVGGGIGVVTGIVLAVAMHQKALILVSVLSVVGTLALYLIDNRQRQQRGLGVAKARQSAQAQIRSMAAEEDKVRRLLAPGPAEIAQMALGARADLWPRGAQSPHGLVLRVGVADQAPSARVRGEPFPGFEVPVLRRVPVTLDLRETGVLGVIGAGEPVRALLRWLLIQLTTLRSADDLRVVLLTSGCGEDIAWARWLPHLDQDAGALVPCRVGNTDASRAARLGELRQLIAARHADSAKSASARLRGEVIVVLDGALALRNLPGIHEVLRDGPEVGVYALCADSQGMNECRGLCEVAADRVRLFRTPDAPMVTAEPDGMDAATAEEVARALAPMRDRIAAADVEKSIPSPVRLLDLLRLGIPAADDVLALWSRKNEGPTTRVVLGADAAGPVTVDLAGQGPHTMLGGATGAGKSILLQTLVTALLLANRPDELNLVLVDFKGGSAFLPFERCPHVIALIRSTGETAADSFDEADAARMLASVRAEVRRRESILARYGGEIDHYWRARQSQPELPPLPRLVMIFDEFARVLDTAPGFLKELVNVAGKGRSLGMHLVLSTQSLQGKLSPELKNNISLRISLRQNEPADSTEVLGAPDAAAIPGTLRGRGMILCTTDESRTPRLFQSGYLGNPPPGGSAGHTVVRTLQWTELGEARPDAGDTGGGDTTDQELTIKAIEEAARQAGVAVPFRALLPALPAQVSIERLPGCWTAEPPGTAAAFGLADEPDLQAQPACYLDLATTDRLLVAGGPQSGRTTFARALITSLAARFRPDQVHVYAVEHQPAGLSDYAGLPHCGGIFSPAEPDRIRRLVGWLDTETERRAANRFDTSAHSDPVIVVVVDGWEQFESRADPALADVSLGPALRDVIATGAPLGVHIVPVGGQDLLTGKVPALCNQRLLLPFPNEDTRRVHLRTGMASPPPLPGRAIDAATGRHVQVCQPTVSAAELTASVQNHYAAIAVDASRLPKPFPSLPARVNVADLPLPQPVPSSSWIPIGVGGAEAATVGVDLFDAGPHLMLISGPPGSGRTTAIATLARLLSWNGIDVVAVAPPRSPLGRMLADEEGIRIVTAATLEDSVLREAAEPLGNRRYAVLLDDADQITVQPTKQGFNDSPTLLDEISRPAQFGHHALVLAADATPILSGQRRSLAKVTNEIMMSGVRLLLTPAKRGDARQLGMALEPDQYFTRPPGRAYLAATNTPTLIQLAIGKTDG
jgi:DNA segregation ATPase FtsK/SpoIIIE, S-DNA-T family